jgi:hypothetical protein
MNTPSIKWNIKGVFFCHHLLLPIYKNAIESRYELKKYCILLSPPAPRRALK